MLNYGTNVEDVAERLIASIVTFFATIDIRVTIFGGLKINSLVKKLL